MQQTLLIAFEYLNRNATSTFNYFSDQGIPGPKPIPIFGNMWGIWKAVSNTDFKKKHCTQSL